MDKKTFIAKRVAQELRDGYVVNLGIGPADDGGQLRAEGDACDLPGGGKRHAGRRPGARAGSEDKDYINAGGAHVTALPGAVFFDSATSFGIIRGGHVDMTVLGALQVDKTGTSPIGWFRGKQVPGMGGAMDLVVGAKRVIVAMEHTAKGNHKILEECSFPLTAASVVDRIITDLAVIDVTEDGLVLREVAEGVTPEDVQAATGAPLTVDPNLKVMHVEE